MIKIKANDINLQLALSQSLILIIECVILPSSAEPNRENGVAFGLDTNTIPHKHLMPVPKVSLELKIRLLLFTHWKFSFHVENSRP